MAVPESEEVGFKRIALSGSDYNASVPIKKRRFPLMQSHLSPSKELSSFHLDENLIKNKQLSLSEGSTVSDSGVVATSGLSKKEDSVSEENKGKSNSQDANMVSFQEPSVTDHACYNGYEEYEEKSMVSEKDELCASPERSGLKLSSTDLVSDPLAGNKGEEIDRNKPEEKCKNSNCEINERAELSVSLKGHIVSDLVPDKSDLNYMKQEPVSPNLSSSKQGSGSHCVTGNPKSDYDGSLLHTNREKWDLNTSMESWEVCASDAPAVPISVVQTNATIGTYICSNETIESYNSLGKQAHLDSEHRINFSNACRPSNDHLHLSLSSFDPKPTVSQERNTSLQLDLDLGKTNPSLSLSSRDMQFGDLNVAMKVAKLEPFGEGSKLDLKGDKRNGLGSLGDAKVKRELDERCNVETHHSLNYCSPMNVVEPSVKSESVCDNKHEALKISGGTFNQAAKCVLLLPGLPYSCPTAMPVMSDITSFARNPSCLTGLTVSNHLGQLTPIEGHLNGEVHQGGCGGGLVFSETVNISKERAAEDSNISYIETSKVEDENDENSGHCPLSPLKLSNEQQCGLQGSGESSESDAEKISISADMLDEDYISEYESDGNQDLAKTVDANDTNIEEDYEDGEVRESMLETEVENHASEKREVEHFDHDDFDDKKINSVRLSGHDCFTIGPVEQEIKSENLDVRTRSSEDGFDTLTKSKSSEQEDEDLCVKELHAEESIVSQDVDRPMKAAGQSQFSQRVRKDNSGGQDTSSDKAIDGIQEMVVTSSRIEVENSIILDVVQNNDLTLPNVKESENIDDAYKDVNCGSKHSRIINLARSSADSSPCKTKSNFIRSVLSRTDRELVPDMALDEANLQPRGRDNGNITNKFSVDRHQDQSSWMSFNRRGGRSSNRLDTRHRNWDFRHNFSSEIYSNHTEYRVPSHKFACAHSDADLNQNRYKITPDGSFGGTSHRGRQFVDDEGPYFFHGPSRRKSPGRRHGPNVRGGKIMSRVPRDFSPNTCMDEGGSESVGQQHGEKFTRNFADETMDPIYARPQPPYEDRPFFRERNFSFHRKSFPRIGSKSPVRSRARSPDQWFSSKRSDRFCGRPEMSRRRSPNYRVDRMRSPDQRPLRGHMEPRRHDFRFLSPPSNELRDVGLTRDRGHVRSFIPNRNQTDRSFRNRRYDVIDPRGRIESDEFFDGPVHSGRLNEHIGSDHDDDERRFNERHEPLHSFQPPYNDSDGVRFHNNEEDCSRHFRFCAENDSRSWKR